MPPLPVSASYGTVQWDPALTSRMRVLLHNQPLIRLHANDDRRREDLRHYAALPLAMRVMDVIVENQMIQETDVARVRQELEPLLTAMDAAAGKTIDEKHHRHMTDLVIGLLRNDEARRAPFAIEYVDFDTDGKPVTRTLSFFLVREHHHASGRMVLRLTNEGLNLYLRGLDLDIESQQAAAEAVINELIRRGKWAEAARSAEAARANSLRYQEKLNAILRETRRDVSRVDWAEETPRLLDDALSYIKERHGVEQGIIQNAQEKLRDLPVDDPNTLQVSDVIQTIRDCQKRHADLQRVLLGARDTFLAEQERQRFAPRLAQPMPDLLHGVLDPLLGMRVKEAKPILTRHALLLAGPRPEGVLSLARLIQWLLRPRRETHQGEVPLEEAEPTYVEADLAMYSEEDRAFAASILDAVQKPTELSALIQHARILGGSDAQVDVLALMVLREYAPEEGETPTLIVQKRDGKTFEDSHLHGDELSITPRGGA